MRSNLSPPTQLEDVTELVQCIQSWLPVKEAARTSILSKPWLYAWSTIPSLRFHVRQRKHLEEWASIAEKWIRSLATITSLKELSISTNLSGASFTLPDEILSVAKNLTKLKVSSSRGIHSFWMTNSHDHPPIIRCVFLREVVLRGVCISQEVLDGILSSCSLLEKIELLIYYQLDLNTIKIKKLPCLDQLEIFLRNGNSSYDPNLRMFRCDLFFGRFGQPFSAYSKSLGSNVTELWLGGLITDDASLDMIKSGFPFLESLTLDMSQCWTLGSFHFTCTSLKRLSLMWFPDTLIDIQVHAPKLQFFLFRGFTMPSFLFPVSTLNQTTFNLLLDMPVDASFFLKMREALMLSNNCDVLLTTRNYRPTLDIDIDDLRKRLPFPPAKNVHRLEFETSEDKCQWEHSPFFDAFFEICHPKHIFAKPDMHFRCKNHFCRMMLKEILEKKTTIRVYWHRYLKHVQIKGRQNWETLTNSHISFLNPQAPFSIDFKLNWL